MPCEQLVPDVEELFLKIWSTKLHLRNLIINHIPFSDV